MNTNDKADNMIEMESGSTAVLHKAKTLTTFPIPSLSGCGKQGAQRGWIFRRLEVDTVIFRLDAIDSLNGGLAIEADQMARLLGCVPAFDYARSKAHYKIAVTSLDEAEKEILRLQRKIKRLEGRKTK